MNYTKKSNHFVLSFAVGFALLSTCLNPTGAYAVALPLDSQFKSTDTLYSASQVTIIESPESKTSADTALVRLWPTAIVGTPDKKVKAVITAYSSTPDQTDDDPFTAASGKRVYDGMIAANWLPFGTIVKIPALFGDKVFTVDDRMNARYGYGRIDIWLDAPIKEVKKFGVQRTEVVIYYQPKELARR